MLTFLSIVLEETNSDTFLFISLTMKIKAAYNLISTHTHTSINTIYPKSWSRLEWEENSMVVYKDHLKAVNLKIL